MASEAHRRRGATALAEDVAPPHQHPERRCQGAPPQMARAREDSGGCLGAMAEETAFGDPPAPAKLTYTPRLGSPTRRIPFGAGA